MSWFRPKTHGYGAYPSNWKGWAAIGVFVLLETVLAVIFIVGPTVAETGPGPVQVVLWIVLSSVLTVAFIRFTIVKTEGEWRWRWGEKN